MNDAACDICCTRLHLCTGCRRYGLKLAGIALLVGRACRCHVVQVIAGLKSDIEALERQSYELQQVRDQLDTRRSQLEADNHELAIKRENLTCK